MLVLLRFQQRMLKFKIHYSTAEFLEKSCETLNKFKFHHFSAKLTFGNRNFLRNFAGVVFNHTDVVASVFFTSLHSNKRQSINHSINQSINQTKSNQINQIIWLTEPRNKPSVKLSTETNKSIN